MLTWLVAATVDNDRNIGYHNPCLSRESERKGKKNGDERKPTQKAGGKNAERTGSEGEKTHVTDTMLNTVGFTEQRLHNAWPSTA